jgi:hypothetical protein
MEEYDYSPDHDRIRTDHNDPFESGVLTHCRPVPVSTIRPSETRLRRLVRWIEDQPLRMLCAAVIIVIPVFLLVDVIFRGLTGT